MFWLKFKLKSSLWLFFLYQKGNNNVVHVGICSPCQLEVQHLTCYRRTNDWSVISVLQSVLLCVSSVPHEGGWLDQGVSGGRVRADPPLQEGDVLSLNCHHRPTSAASGRPTNLHSNKTYSDNLVRFFFSASKPYLYILMHLIMELYWSLYWSALGDIFLWWRQLVNVI